MNKAACLSIVKNCLTDLDYGEGCIERDYVFPAMQKLAKADFVAFSNRYRKDLATSCIAVQFCANESEIEDHKRSLPYTAAPLAILPTPTSVVIQPQSLRREGGLPQQVYGYDAFNEYVGKNRYSFLAVTLQAAKREGRQLSLFELDPTLYRFAAEVSKNELVRRFEDAIRKALEHMAPRSEAVEEEYTKHIVKVAIRLLAARTLEDKRIIAGGAPGVGAEYLFRRASEKFPGYFNWTDTARIGNTTRGKETTEIILESLGKDYSYRTISSEQLGYFYEHTFVSQKLRRELGIYYTPQAIAKEMLKALPIEEIRPENRYVLDGTCGSGSLLTAAYDRIFQLLPKSWREKRKHDFLVERMHGIDKDPFAVEIAKKSLLLASLPFGNSWAIEEKDFLENDGGRAGVQPYIIVANPPFKERRKEVLEQKATIFLDKYLKMLPDGGLLGIVLPESFLQNQSCRGSRKRLLGSIEILEMWQLPEGAFPMAQCGTVILCGRKTEGRSGRSIRFKRLLKKSDLLESSFDRMKFDLSYVSTVVKDWENDAEYEMNTSVFQDIWTKLMEHRLIGDFFHVKNGIIPGKLVDLSGIRYFESNRLYKYLNTSEQLDSHIITWNRKSDPKLVYQYPGKLLRPRLKLKDIFKEKNRKVLINANMAPTCQWRLHAAVDREGFFFSQGIHCLFPKSIDSPELEVLAAVLNGHIANAFIDSFARKRWITEKNIKKIPMPRLSSDQTTAIVEGVRAIEDARRKAASHDALFSESSRAVEINTGRINEILLDGYGLSGKERTKILRFFNEGEKSSITFIPHDIGKVTGRIYEVNPDKQKMQVWVLGYDDTERPQELAIPDSLPGWALRGNVDFEATIALDQGKKPSSVNDMSFLEFKMLRNAYLPDDEIEKMMTKPRD